MSARSVYPAILNQYFRMPLKCPRETSTRTFENQYFKMSSRSVYPDTLKLAFQHVRLKRLPGHSKASIFKGPLEKSTQIFKN